VERDDALGVGGLVGLAVVREGVAVEARAEAGDAGRDAEVGRDALLGDPPELRSSICCGLNERP
jgi:hypothetical protein